MNDTVGRADAAKDALMAIRDTLNAASSQAIRAVDRHNGTELCRAFHDLVGAIGDLWESPQMKEAWRLIYEMDKPKPKGKEWRTWEGGACPTKRSRVDVRLRDGRLYENVAAGLLVWARMNAACDIVEWRESEA